MSSGSRWWLASAPCVALAVWPSIEGARAQDAVVELPAVTVTGAGGAPRSMTDVSPAVTAQPANTTVVTSEAIEKLPVASYGDIFRSLPGFNVNSFNQGIIGYGLTLRGFTDGDHGRDIAYFIDGVPINEVSSQHITNYADLNPLIPETVERIDIVRGPFSVEYGDSNLGGSINIVTKRAEPFASAGISGGSFGALRGVATYSSTSGSVLPFAAFEMSRTNGYADNSEVRKMNAFLKTTILVENGAEVSVRGQVYKGEGGASSYISRDLLDRGLISDKAAVNATDGSQKFMQNVVVNYRRGAPDEELSGTLYLNHDTFDRWSDFGGGQRAQLNERTTAGGTIRKIWTTSMSGIPVQVLTGANWRTDVIDALQAPSFGRVANLSLRARDLGINQTNLAGFAQVQVKPASWLKLTGGVRADQFFYNVENRVDPLNSPHPNMGALSPKAGIAITPLSWLEFFGNYGEGLRSPNAADELLSNANLKPLKLRSQEVGVRATFARVSLMADVWQTDIDNEVFQPAPGLPVQNLGQSWRRGIDLEGKVVAYRSEDTTLTAFVNYSPTEARLVGGGASRFVPQVPVSLLNVGFDYQQRLLGGDQLTASAYMTFVGKKYLAEDGSQTAKPYQRVSAKLAYRWRSGWDAFAQATWYPGERHSESAFNFGNPTGATPADIFVRPVAELTLLAGANYRFATR
ncbi:MAG: cirA [Hyphomicrobiales bacterium]|nr:cirA [Hyphomicrobiales bacterium]